MTSSSLGKVGASILYLDIILRRSAINRMTIPKARPRLLAVVPMVIGSCIAATADVAVDLRNDAGSMKTTLLLPVTRTPVARVLVSRDRIAHCIGIGARLFLCKCPDEPLKKLTIKYDVSF